MKIVSRIDRLWRELKHQCKRTCQESANRKFVGTKFHREKISLQIARLNANRTMILSSSKLIFARKQQLQLPSAAILPAQPITGRHVSFLASRDVRYGVSTRRQAALGAFHLRPRPSPVETPSGASAQRNEDTSVAGRTHLQIANNAAVHRCQRPKPPQ